MIYIFITSTNIKVTVVNKPIREIQNKTNRVLNVVLNPWKLVGVDTLCAGSHIKRKPKIGKNIYSKINRFFNLFGVLTFFIMN